jgi:hypothetical protein
MVDEGGGVKPRVPVRLGGKIVEIPITGRDYPDFLMT